jgi:hypothetical protein
VDEDENEEVVVVVKVKARHGLSLVATHWQAAQEDLLSR